MSSVNKRLFTVWVIDKYEHDIEFGIEQYKDGKIVVSFNSNSEFEKDQCIRLYPCMKDFIEYIHGYEDKTVKCPCFAIYVNRIEDHGTIWRKMYIQDCKKCWCNCPVTWKDKKSMRPDGAEEREYYLKTVDLKPYIIVDLTARILKSIKKVDSLVDELSKLMDN